MKILITGGAGYIGSHTTIAILEAGHEVVIIDNLSNSSEKVVRRIEEISDKPVPLHIFNLEDVQRLSNVFKQTKFDAVIHFAGLKAVGESVAKPLSYYRTNIDATLSLLEVMDEYDVRKLIFSSSATVYGSAPVPYEEEQNTGVGITNPYGQTKYFIEQILRDAATANPKNQFTSLRYFNPIGAHPSGLIGELPKGTPNNLMPYIAQVANGERPNLPIFGGDYETVDGTGVRDYIHVVDLAKGHLAALEHSTDGFSVYNLGRGKGTSVLELLYAFERASGVTIPYEIMPRRSGDLATYYANVDKASTYLNWKAYKSIEDACVDTWRWQQNNG